MITNIRIKSGVNTEMTPALNEAGISSSNLIRFWGGGLVQKLGGWVKFINHQWNAAIRTLKAWEGLSSDIHLAVATANTLDVITNGVLRTITPQILTRNFTPNLSTIAGSNVVRVTDPGSSATVNDDIVINTPVAVGGIVLSGPYSIPIVNGTGLYEIIAASPAISTVDNGGVVPIFETTNGHFNIKVTLPNHGYVVGETVSFVSPTPVGGLIIQGLYAVVSINDPNKFIINAETVATSTATAPMNNGLAQIVYHVTPGEITFGTGYGVGGYGKGGYGFGLTIPSHTGIPITATDWTLDNFGKFLMAVPFGGPLYQWAPDSGFTTASIVPTAPTVNGGVFLSMPAEILVLWGASVLGVQDPLRVAWCQPGDFTVWTATVTNQAGSYRIPRGARIIGGLQGPLQGLIWTDLAIWSMSYIGLPFIFSFTEIAAGCGLIGRHAMGVVDQNVFWMNQNGFYILPAGGSVTPLPCTVWDVVFQNLNMSMAWKIQGAPNSLFGEMTWFFPSLNSTENDSYVKYNVTEGVWDYGSMPRSAWIDQSILGPPIGGSPDGHVYLHETGQDADGLPMDSWMETGYFALSETDQVVFIDQCWIDFRFGLYGGSTNATIQLTWKGTMYATQAPRVYGPFIATSSTHFVEPKVRARMVSLRVESTDLGSFWRMGNLRVRMQPNGRR